MYTPPVIKIKIQTNRKFYFQQVSSEITQIQEIFGKAKPSALNRQSEGLYRIHPLISVPGERSLYESKARRHKIQ